jgi:hypothetical protein
MGSGTSLRLCILIAFIVTFAVSGLAQEPVYEVKIVFTGIMAFQLGANTATVFLPNIKNGGIAGDDDHMIHPHVAYILADRRYMDPTLELNDDLDFEDANFEGGTYHYVTLQGDQIALDDENDIPLLNPPLIYKTKGAEPCPVHNANPLLDTSTSMYWVAGMAEVTKNIKLDPETKYFDRRPKRKDVSARASLHFGWLDAHVVTPGVIWTLQRPVKPPTDATITRTLAEEVVWTFKARGNPFVLNLLNFDGTSRRVAFTPVDSNVTMIIGNTMHSDTGPIPNPSADPRDDHYSVYHRLIKNNTKASGQVPHDSTRRCKVVGDPDALFDATLMPKATPPASSSSSELKPLFPSASGLDCVPTQWP